MEILILPVLLLIGLWFLFWPASVAYRIGNRIKSADWQEVKTALMGTSFISPFFLLYSFSLHTHHPGSSDGDFLGLRSLGYAIRNFGVSVAYVWVGTVACAVVFLLTALIVRWRRRRRGLRIAEPAPPIAPGDYDI